MDGMQAEVAMTDKFKTQHMFSGERAVLDRD